MAMTFILSLFVAFADAAPAAPTATAIELLDVGEYTRVELPAGTSSLSGWLALCADGGPATVELRPARVALRAASHGGPWEVSATGCASPLALLRGPPLRPGPVETPPEDKGKIAAFTFRGQRYRVKRDVPEPRTEDQCGKKRARFVLTVGRVRQALADTDFCVVFTLRWAGDLDADGKLDFLVVENMDSGAKRVRLYVSRGVQEKHRAVREVVSVLRSS